MLERIFKKKIGDKEGLFIKQSDTFYWNVYAKNLKDVILLTTETKELAEEAAHELASIFDWNGDCSILADVKINNPDLHRNISTVLDKYEVEERLNYFFKQTMDSDGYVTYECEGKKTKGLYINDCFAISKQKDLFRIDHVPSGEMLNLMSSEEKAKEFIDWLMSLYNWDQNRLFAINEFIVLQLFLEEGQNSIEKGKRPPKKTPTIDLLFFFSSFPELRDRWPVFEKAWNKLQNMVGLDNIKNQVDQLVYQRKAELSNPRPIDKKTSYHMVFLGPPGTGKTEVARLIGDLLYGLDIVEKGHFVEEDRTSLISNVIGGTEKNMEKAINDAIGGTLFIDEAYQLIEDEGDTRDFGRKAVQSLITALENRRDELVVIFAGYKNEMKKLSKVNEGFDSRIRFTFNFKDYTPEQMIEISHRMLNSEGYVFNNEDTEKLFVEFFKKKHKSGELTGNARSVRTIKDNLIDTVNYRIARNNASDRFSITEEDVRKCLSPQSPIREQDGLVAIRDEALAELDALIGMDSVKETAQRMIRTIAIEQERFKRGLSTEKPRLHMAFIGPPGTGKTTVAKIIGKFLNGVGVLEEGRFHPTSGSSISPNFKADDVDNVFEKAFGGVLFIDEAYGMVGIHSENQILSRFVDLMESKKDEIAVILAGYENEMNALFDRNAGFRSRIAYSFNFESYTPENLKDILLLRLKKREFHFNKEVEEAVLDFYNKVGPQSGNGRDAERHADKIINTQSLRVSQYNISTLSNNDLTNINLEDVYQALQF